MEPFSGSGHGGGVKEDLIKGGSLEKDSSSEYIATRVFLVTGVSGEDGPTKMKEALDSGSIPAISDEYPSIPDIQVIKKSAKVVDVDKIRVTVNYGTPASSTGSSKVDTGAVMEIVGASTELETNKDATEADMVLGTLDWWEGEKGYTTGDSVVSYGGEDNKPHVYLCVGDATTGIAPADDPEGWIDGGPERGSLAKSRQNVIVQKYSPTFRVKLSRTETENPAQRVRDYTGTLNDGSVVFGGVEWGRGLLLCESISATTDDEGNSYSVTYNFIYNPDGWDVTAIYTSDDGIPEARYKDMDKDGLAGSDTFTIYKSMDFNELDLNTD